MYCIMPREHIRFRLCTLRGHHVTHRCTYDIVYIVRVHCSRVWLSLL